MFKSTFLAFIAFFICLSAQAGSYIRTHEDYVHLSDYEKNQLIIKTMELVVALESQYNYQVKKYGYNSERFERFIKAVSKVKSILFIDSAYAAPSPKKPMTDWSSYGNAFKQLMNKSGSNCFFAGWPSKTYVQNGKTYCAHPDFLQGDSPTRHRDKPMMDWTKYYPDPKADSGCGANDRKKIQCNPAIFGFKNASKGNLFCVAASDGAHNSAYNCMQEALKERPADSPIDSPAKRLGDLRISLDGNKDAFKAIQDFVYKTCVCDSSPKNFNSNYQAYVRKHRTCYGMMEMMAAVTCGATTPLMDTSIFTSLRNYAQEKIIYNAESESSNTSETMVDHHYEMFIKNEVQVSAKDEYNFLCKGIARPEVVVKPTKDYECSKATCEAKVTEGVTSFACSSFAINVKGTSEAAQLDAAPTEVPGAATETSLAITGAINGTAVSLTCPLVIKAPESTPLTYTCSKADCKTIAAATPEGKPTFECSYVVVDNNGEVATFAAPGPTDTPAGGAVQTEGAVLAITGKIGTQDVSLSCPLTIAPAEKVTVDNEPQDSYECSKAECSAVSAVASTDLPGLSTDEPTVKPAAFTCTLETNLKGDEEKIPLSASPEGTPTDGSNSKFKVKIGEQDIELSCPVTLKKAAVTPKIEPVSTPKGGFVGSPQNPGPPRQPVRGASDTSASGIR